MRLAGVLQICIVFSVFLPPGQGMSNAEDKNINQLMRSAGKEHHHRHGHHHHQHLGEHEAIVNADGSATPRKGRRAQSCTGSEECLHYRGRFRPYHKHKTEKKEHLKSRAFKAEAEVLVTGFYDPLPMNVTCTLGVDDTLDAVYYAGQLLNLSAYGQKCVAGSQSGAGTVPNGYPQIYNPYTASLTSVFTAQPSIVFSFVPVAMGTLTIIAHDAEPGTGSASCAGLSISCLAFVPNGNTSGSPWELTNTYSNWLVRGQKTAALDDPTNPWYVPAPGTSWSLGCGITRSAPVVFWQDGFKYFAANWTGPMGPTTPTTTTTVTNATVNVTKAGALQQGPSFLLTTCALTLLVMRGMM